MPGFFLLWLSCLEIFREWDFRISHRKKLVRSIPGYRSARHVLFWDSIPFFYVESCIVSGKSVRVVGRQGPPTSAAESVAKGKQTTFWGFGIFFWIPEGCLPSMDQADFGKEKRAGGSTMELKQIYKRPVYTITEDAELEDAARLMRDHHVGDLVVIQLSDGKRVPVGILTDRDIVMATVALGVTPSALSVGNVMTRNLVLAREEDSLEQALNQMKDHGVKRIPIVGIDQELLGIVSLEDIMNFVAEEFLSISRISDREKEQELLRRRKFA